MHLRLSHNIRQFQRGLNDQARRQIPFALSLAINEVLKDIQKNWLKRLRKEIDRPTPFTMKAFAIRRASKRSLTGMIFAKDIQADYLSWLEEGGERAPKRRAIMVPVRQRRNRYGNMPRGAVGRALASPKTFSGKPKGRSAAGLYQRTGKGKRAKLKLLVSYEDRARYAPSLRLKIGAMKTASARLPRALYRALRRSMQG